MKKNQNETNESRIYCVVAGSIQVPVVPDSHKPPLRTVIQPAGRQVAQACHVVSLLRHGIFTFEFDHQDRSNKFEVTPFEPITTIILQARDSAEMAHVHYLWLHKRLQPVMFSDNNPEYGPGDWPTAIAVLAAPRQIQGASDYLPLWGSK